MTKHLRTTSAGDARCPIKRWPKGLPRRSGAKAGWTPERRAVQAALIRRWQPWRSSTGPKTEIGKARCAMNALKHGKRSLATIREFQRIRRVLRLAAQNVAALRLFIRLREASSRPRIKYKPWYETQLRQALSADLNSAPGVVRERRADRGRFGMHQAPARPFREPPIQGTLLRYGGMFESPKRTRL
jgi:hypothetical protein